MPAFHLIYISLQTSIVSLLPEPCHCLNRTVRPDSSLDKSAHHIHQKHVLSNKKMESVRRTATCTALCSSRPPCLNFRKKIAPLGCIPVRLCVCFVQLCELFKFNCGAFYFVDNPGQSSGNCASIIGFFELVSKLLRNFNL